MRRRRGYKDRKYRRHRFKRWLTCAEHVEAFRVNRKGRIAQRKWRALAKRKANKKTLPLPSLPAMPGRRIGKSEYPRRPSYTFHTAYARFADRSALELHYTKTGELP